jgi:hypothetical protein
LFLFLNPFRGLFIEMTEVLDVPRGPHVSQEILFEIYSKEECIGHEMEGGSEGEEDQE